MNRPDADEAGSVYRWVIVTTSALMLAVSMGMMVNGFSVFFIPLNDEFGWQLGAVSLINFSGLAGLAIGGVVMGRIADQTSTRSVCMVGSLTLGICIFLASYAQALWQFYLLFFIAGFLGAGALFAPLIANVGNWFVTGAGLAVGIASAGQALGQGGVPYVIALLIGSMGWRDALWTMGLISLVGLFSMSLLIKQPVRRNDSLPLTADAGIDDLPTILTPKKVAIWLGVGALFCCTCMAVPLMHLVPLIQDRGFSIEDAGSVVFLMLIVAIAGRIFFGKLADMIGAIRAYLVASLWQTLLVLGFMQITSLTSFYVFAVVYGFGYAGVMTGLLISAHALTPSINRGFVLGVVTFFAFLGHGLGGYQGGFFFDLTGNYTVTFINAALAGIINLFIVGALYLTVSRRLKLCRAVARSSVHF